MPPSWTVSRPALVPPRDLDAAFALVVLEEQRTPADLSALYEEARR